MSVITTVLLSGAAGALIALLSVRPSMRKQLDEVRALQRRAEEQDRAGEFTDKLIRDMRMSLLALKDDKKGLEDQLVVMHEMARRKRVEYDGLMSSYIKATKSSISSIRFTARVPTDGWVKTTFKLGRGTCGKDVELLRFKEEADRYIITQVCTDDERKEFIYFKADVDGRIEVAHNGI